MTSNCFRHRREPRHRTSHRAEARFGAGRRSSSPRTTRENNEKVVGEISAAGGAAFAMFVDMSSQDSIKEAFAEALKQAGQIDILVNNAGITKDGLALRMKKDDWDAVLSTNLTGAFLAISAGAARHDEGALGPHHQHLVGGRGDGQSRTGELRRVEGRLDRPDQVARAGNGQPQHHGERRRARLHRDRHDRRAAAGSERHDAREDLR